MKHEISAPLIFFIVLYTVRDMRWMCNEWSAEQRGVYIEESRKSRFEFYGLPRGFHVNNVVNVRWANSTDNCGTCKRSQRSQSNWPSRPFTKMEVQGGYHIMIWSKMNRTPLYCVNGSNLQRNLNRFSATLPGIRPSYTLTCLFCSESMIIVTSSAAPRNRSMISHTWAYDANALQNTPVATK